MDYAKRYSFSYGGPLFNDVFKIHKCQPSEGYHTWHSEWVAQYPEERRMLVWHISLTSHENEGEIEFLYHEEYC